MTTAKPVKRPRGEGQWKLGYREPLNPNEQFKKDDDALNVRSRILDIYSKQGFDSIDKQDLRGRMRWMGLYTQREQGYDGTWTGDENADILEAKYFMMRVRCDGGALTNAALRTLVLHSPHDVYPGPYTYKRFWFRDAALILNAMLGAGMIERSERTLEGFAARQTRNGYFLSQEGEWDSNGEALWAHCSTNLHWLVRQHPFAQATLKDCDWTVDFATVNQPGDRAYQSPPFSTAATNRSPPCSDQVTSGGRVRPWVRSVQSRTP